jgi:signal peptidase I
MAVVDAFRAYWCEAFVIPTNSMANTLLSGDRILVEKLAFNDRDLKQGSVLVFRAPQDRHAPDTIVVKRLIALGGDTIRMEKDHVYVNGSPLDEPYAIFEGDPPHSQFDELRNRAEQTVPEDHVFLIGDNRWQSLDSRSFGFVPVASLIGEAKMIFWSRDYELIPPSLEKPQGGEQWGAIRWDRIGKAIRQ